MASSESNLYPNVSFSSRQQVKAVPIVTVTTPILVVHAQTQRTGRLQKSYIPQYFPYRPPMAMAERPFSILKVIVAAPFFSSCYFKVELLHSVTLRTWAHSNLAYLRLLFCIFKSCS